MNVAGSHLLVSTPSTVFSVMNSPGELLSIIPGCQEIQQISPTEYRGLISLRLPAIVGNYQTYVKLIEWKEPIYSRFEGYIEGSLGSVKGSAAFRLVEKGAQTMLEYEGQGIISGTLARLDTRFVEGLAKSLIDQGLARLDDRLQQAESAAAAHRKEEDR